MKATVVKINHPNQHMSPAIYVRVNRSSKNEQVDAFWAPHLYDELRVGQVIEVKRITNSPYLYIA